MGSRWYHIYKLNTTKHGMKCHFTTKAIHILPIIYTYEFKEGNIQMKEKKKKEHSESWRIHDNAKFLD